MATNNRGKLEELRALSRHLDVEWVTVKDVLGASLSVVEDGDTFERNATKKAQAAALATGCWALADDSGLEVDALDLLPGVQSARYAGEGASDEENNQKLLVALSDVEGERRTARFRCVLALVVPSLPSVVLTSGVCEGVIAAEPRGLGGFGYDPLFIVRELGQKTMAELTPEEKNRVSHRAKAMQALGPILTELVSERSL
jgi:XTP/dITP diphosphohydrolase